MPISEQIKAWRKAKDISLEKAAQIIGVTVSTLYRYEHGQIPSSLGKSALIKAGVINP